MAELPQILREYENDLRVIRNRSERTVEQYEIDLTLFFRFLIAQERGIPLLGDGFDNLDISGIDIERLKRVDRLEVLEFLSYAGNERKNQARARARKLSALKSFFKYLTVTVRCLETSPAADIDTPTIHPALPKFLSAAESRRLLDAVANDVESRTRARDYAIITLFLNCGMRLSELVGISLGDLDSEMKTLRVLGKGSKERMLYLNDACRSAIKEYLPLRAADEAASRCDALFLSGHHRRISNKTVQWMVYKYLDAAGLGNRRLSTHKLRHTAATLMYQTGKVDVRTLKDILGHEQLNTTQIYTHVSDAQMASAMDLNPLSQLEAPSGGITGTSLKDPNDKKGSGDE